MGRKTKIFKEFGDSTTIHGVTYMVNADKTFDRQEGRWTNFDNLKEKLTSSHDLEIIV